MKIGHKKTHVDFYLRSFNITRNRATKKGLTSTVNTVVIAFAIVVCHQVC